MILTLALALSTGCGRGSEELSPVLVVSIEGADLGYVRPLIADGKLPNLARLFREGVHGTCFSTVPPSLPPAWVAATTGKNPGQTGIYQWAVLEPASYHGVPVMGSTFAREKRVWDLVGEAGGRVIVINVPLTFPPIKVEGVLTVDLMSIIFNWRNMVHN